MANQELIEYEQPSSAPVPKVAAVGVAGSVVTAILLLGTLFGVKLEPELVNQAVVGVSALVTLVTFLAGYFKKDAKPAKVVKAIK